MTGYQKAIFSALWPQRGKEPVEQILLEVSLFNLSHFRSLRVNSKKNETWQDQSSSLPCRPERLFVWEPWGSQWKSARTSSNRRHAVCPDSGNAGGSHMDVQVCMAGWVEGWHHVLSPGPLETTTTLSVKCPNPHLNFPKFASTSRTS
jgi:hypothetical protein